MTTTQQIIKTFTEQVDTNKEYTRAELGILLTQVFNDLKNEGKSVKKSPKKKVDDDERKKREPSSYNLFVKETMPTLKKEFPDISRQDLMKKVGEMWRDNKDISLSKKYNSSKKEDERINIQSLVAKMSSPNKTSSSIADEILSKSKLKPKSPPKPPPLPETKLRVRKPLQSPRKSSSKSILTKEGLEMAKSKLKPKSPPKPPPLPPPPKRSSPKKSKSKLTKEELEIAKSKLKHTQKKINPDHPDYYLEMAFKNLEKNSPKRSSPKRSSPKKSKSRSPPKINPDNPDYYLEMAFRNLEK